MPFAYKLKDLPAAMLGVPYITKLPRETSSRHFWVGGFSSSTFHPWQMDTFWNPKQNAFINKNRNEQDSKVIFLFCIFFPSCLAIFCWCVCFQYVYFSIAQYLENNCMQRSPLLVKKQRYIHQRRTCKSTNEWEDNSNFFAKVRKKIVGSILLLHILNC